MTGTSQRGEISQTLDRGLRVLKLVTETPIGLTINDLATTLSLNRTVVYRLLTTLAEHRLISRDAEGRYWPATGLLELAKSFAPHLREVAMPHLHQLAAALGATAHLTVADGEEAVAVAVVEPRLTIFHVAYRVGSRHALDIGAAGIAILSGRPSSALDSAAIRDARRRGYASTTGELQAGAVGVAAPIECTHGIEDASVGVVALSDLMVEQAGPYVVTAAHDIAEGLRVMDVL